MTDVSNVYVKPYWETIKEALCCCWPGRRNKTQYERLLDQEEAETEARLAQTSPILRWIALLLSGYYLPDNQQLYAALHRFAGVLDGVAQAKDPQDDGTASDPLIVGKAATSVLEEIQGLCKDVARWLTSKDAEIAAESGTKKIPNGNSRHQLQRLVFHVSRLLKKQETPVPASVDVSAAVPEIETVKETAEQAVEDLRLVVYSVAQLAISTVTSDQLTNAIRDALNATRDAAADAVHGVVTTSAAVEDTIRPSQKERQEPLGEELRGIKDAAQTSVADAAQFDPAALANQMRDIPQDTMAAAKQKIPNGQQIAEKIGNMLGKIMDEDESFRAAVQNLVGIAHKYCEGARSVAQGAVPEPIQEALTLDENTTLEDRKQAADINPDLLLSITAARELLEGLAGGKSLDPILDECGLLWAEVRDRIVLALDEWTQQVQQIVEEEQPESLKEAGSTFSQEFQELFGRIVSIVQDRPDTQERFERIVSLSQGFFAEIAREPRLVTIFRRFGSIYSAFATVFDQQARRLAQEGVELMTDMYSKILPALLNLLGNVPLPRIEFTSPNVDAALDDLSIAAVGLLPAQIRFESKQVLEWNRVASMFSKAAVQQGRVEVSGLRLAIKNTSFFFREKATQTSSVWLNKLFCAMPRASDKVTASGRQEEGHLGAYREQALLDFGLFGKQGTTQGAQIVIDLENTNVEVEEDEEDEEDAGKNEGLWKINSAALVLSDSFDLRLHRSRHYIVNSLVVEPMLAPLLRKIVEYAAGAMMQQGLNNMSSQALDLHLRAKYLARKSRGATTADPRDYLKVFFDAKAGKSQLRLRREAAAAEEERLRAEEAERQYRLTQQEIDQQEQPEQERPKMEFKPTGIIINPSDDISISIAAFPTLLPTYAQGPETTRVQVRNAVVQNEVKQLVKNRADETLAELAVGASAVKSTAKQARDLAVDAKDGIQEARDLAGHLDHIADERDEIEEARVIDEEGGKDLEDQEEEMPWRHAGFDLS